MAIRKFGQYVLLTIQNEKGEVIFETDNLKVDFDIRHVRGYSRAKVTITNLNPSTIKKLSNAKGGNYVTIKTSLHDGPLELLADRLYISNALEEIKVPISTLNLYCYSSLLNKVLEKQIDLLLTDTKIEGIINSVTTAAGFTGKVEYKHFPDEVLNYKPPRSYTKQQGSAINIIEALGEEHRFNLYTEGPKLVVMYKPDIKNVASTDFFLTKEVIKLSTTNMRATPKIGPATLSVTTNLDSRIKPAVVLDITELLTVGTNVDEENLQLLNKYLREKIAGFSKYQTLSVQHKGSNWADLWMTQATATSPTPGTTASSSETRWWI